MRRHGSTLRWVVAGMLCLVTANAAWAHILVKSTGNFRQANAITTTPGAPPPADFLGTRIWPTYTSTASGGVFTPDPDFNFYHNDADGTFQHRTYVGAYFDNTGGAATNKVAVTAIAIGEGSQAGRLGTSVYLPPDTAFAGVGLYGPGPLDSMLIAIVDRSNSNQLNISFSNSSALQVRSLGNSHEQPRAVFRMLVYEDQATADADLNHTGSAAKFNGTVILDGNSGTLSAQSAFGNSAQHGFVASDWFLVNNGGGKYTARPSPGLVKHVSVLNSTNACVVLFADPVIAQPTPGASPAILILLSLVLAATGFWAIRKRSGPSFA